MSLRCVGFCGVDDTIDVDLLQLIALRYSRAEFGVLFREDKEGTPRYPSQEWITRLSDLAASSVPPLRLAAHLCGQRCAEFLDGNHHYVQAQILPVVSNGFRSMQLQRMVAKLQTTCLPQRNSTRLLARGASLRLSSRPTRKPDCCGSRSWMIYLRHRTCRSSMMHPAALVCLQKRFQLRVQMACAAATQGASAQIQSRTL